MERNRMNIIYFHINVNLRKYLNKTKTESNCSVGRRPFFGDWEDCGKILAISWLYLSKYIYIVTIFSMALVYNFTKFEFQAVRQPLLDYFKLR